MKKTEVIKHSAAVQITNRVGLNARRAFNILLAEAFDELTVKPIHEVKAKDVMNALGLTSSNNMEHLKDTLRSLASTLLEWNVLKKDGKNSWGIASLLSGATIEDGKIRYSFDNILREKLHSPAMYAKISLSIQNRFDSKHSLAIYELCVDYFDISRQQGETAWMTIEQFRKLMGLGDDEYPEFKHLNMRVIKEPVKEINEKSNLWVEVAYQRKRRRVVSVKFYITPNPNKDNFVQKLEAKHPALPAPEDIEHPKIYKRLIAYFEFTDGDARQALKQYDADYIAGNLDEIERRRKTGWKPKSLRAFTFKALENDYRTQTSLFDIEEEQEKQKRIKARKSREEAQRRAEEAEAERLRKEAEHYNSLYDSLSAQERKQIDAAVINGLDEFWRSKYNEAKRKNDNIENSPLLVRALQMKRQEILEQKYPQAEETV